MPASRAFLSDAVRRTPFDQWGGVFLLAISAKRCKVRLMHLTSAFFAE